MAKSFSTIKKALGLLDFLQFGKYKGCRVDSLIEHDDDYLRYLHDQGVKFDVSVLDALANKFSATNIEANSADDASYFDDGSIQDDLPF